MIAAVVAAVRSLESRMPRSDCGEIEESRRKPAGATASAESFPLMTCEIK
jgi:hypothetical protein